MEHFLTCPYCGETISMVLDTSTQEQTYIEDCEVCCRPIEIRYAVRMIPSSSLRPGVQREANFTIAPATAAGRVSGIQCWAPGMTSRLAFGSAWCKRAACSKGKCLSCSAHSTS